MSEQISQCAMVSSAPPLRCPRRRPCWRAVDLPVAKVPARCGWSATANWQVGAPVTLSLCPCALSADRRGVVGRDRAARAEPHRRPVQRVTTAAATAVRCNESDTRSHALTHMLTTTHCDTDEQTNKARKIAKKEQKSLAKKLRAPTHVRCLSK